MIRPNISPSDALKSFPLPRPKPRTPKKPQRRSAVTVCIAAICTYYQDDIEEWFRWPEIDKPQPYIIGISDRMVSTDYTQSELPRPKFANIVNSIMALMGGHIASQTDVFERTHSYFASDFRDDSRIIQVKEVAERYSRNIATFLNERRDRMCFALTGKEWNDFVKEKKWPSYNEIIREIEKKPSMPTIITGIDESGAHIYVVDINGYFSCEDSIGFAAIGSGEFHADPQLMRIKHSIKASYPDTLLLTYIAKKQAEVDPDVGKETDIFVIKDESDWEPLHETTVTMLKDTYNAIYDKLLDEAKKKIQKHLIEERKKSS